MKKSYVYFLIPLAALAVFFFGFYWNAHKDFEAREQAKVDKVKAEKDAKLMKEAKDREIAVRAAIEMQEKRKKEPGSRSPVASAYPVQAQRRHGSNPSHAAN